MSIVGTRPPLISETNLYEPRHKARLAIKPGITGMWQVSGRSDITDFEEVVRLDKGYFISGIIIFTNRFNGTNINYSMPFAPVIMVVVLLTMIAFYATSFDSIALTASCYSYHKLEDGEQPNKGIQLMWCVLLILLPIALLFAESSMNNLQSVSIVAAFPIGAVIVMITASFMKDAKKYMENLEEGKIRNKK